MEQPENALAAAWVENEALPALRRAVDSAAGIHSGFAQVPARSACDHFVTVAAALSTFHADVAAAAAKAAAALDAALAVHAFQLGADTWELSVLGTDADVLRRLLTLLDTDDLMRLRAVCRGSRAAVDAHQSQHVPAAGFDQALAGFGACKFGVVRGAFGGLRLTDSALHLGRVIAAIASIPTAAEAIRLDLASCCLSSPGMRMLGTALDSRSVTVLMLTDNPLTDTGVAALIAALPNSRLTGLGLGGVRMTLTGFVPLMSWVASQPALASLDASRNNLCTWSAEPSPLGHADLATTLSTVADAAHGRLSHLDVSGCFGPAHAEAWTDVLSGTSWPGPQSSLMSLVLSHTDFGHTGTNVQSPCCLTLLGESLIPGSWVAFTTLGLSHARLTAARLPFFCDQLGANATLLALDLSWNALGPEGVGLLAGALAGNGTLTDLELTGCTCGDAGAVSLAGALRGNVALDKLGLGSNNIGPSGCERLGAALPDCRLRTLALRGNPLGLPGLESLAQSLSRVSNRSLSTLDVSGCGLGPWAAPTLAALAAADVTMLWAEDNGLGDAGVRSLATLLRERADCGVSALHLGSNGADGRLESATIAALVDTFGLTALRSVRLGQSQSQTQTQTQTQTRAGARAESGAATVVVELQDNCCRGPIEALTADGGSIVVTCGNYAAGKREAPAVAAEQPND